ncbi:hypothetical protein L345_18203, partial [Ophiophagus hannah]
EGKKKGEDGEKEGRRKERRREGGGRKEGEKKRQIEGGRRREGGEERKEGGRKKERGKEEGREEGREGGRKGREGGREEGRAVLLIPPSPRLGTGEPGEARTSIATNRKGGWKRDLARTSRPTRTAPPTSTRQETLTEEPSWRGTSEPSFPSGLGPFYSFPTRMKTLRFENRGDVPRTPRFAPFFSHLRILGEWDFPAGTLFSLENRLDCPSVNNEMTTRIPAKSVNLSGKGARKACSPPPNKRSMAVLSWV